MVYDRECAAAGIDPADVASLKRRLERLCRDADKLGITVFMGSTSSLRARDHEDHALILASIDVLNVDGGDGGYREASDGLLRGE